MKAWILEIIGKVTRFYLNKAGCLHGLAAACRITAHYHPCSNLRVGISEGVFHLGLHFITFGGRLAHLAYPVHKSGRKTSIITIII